jgi:hypothetical protein
VDNDDDDSDLDEEKEVDMTPSQQKKSLNKASTITTPASSMHSASGKKKKEKKKEREVERHRDGDEDTSAAATRKHQQQLDLYGEQNKLFMQQMASMQDVLKTHTTLVQSLKHQNLQLQNENLESEKKIQLANKVAREQEKEHERTLQMALQQRNLAAQSLAFVSDQYVGDMKGQINHHQQRGGINSHTTEVYIPTTKSLSTPSLSPDFVDESQEQEQEVAYTDRGLHMPRSSSGSSLGSHPASPHRPPSPSQMDQMLAMHETPVRTARHTIVSSSGRQRSGGDSSGPPDIVAQMAKDAEREIHQWKKMLKVYKFSQQPLDIAAYDDANATMRSVAAVISLYIFVVFVVASLLK